MSETEFQKVVDAIEITLPDKPNALTPGRLNGFSETMWCFKFQIRLNKITFSIDIFVPDSVPATDRQADATSHLKTFAKAFAQKAEAL